MSTTVFEEYLERLEREYEVDAANDAIDIAIETSGGENQTVTLVAAQAGYTLFVSPLVKAGKGADAAALHRRLLELSDQDRHVKYSLDADGDVKLSAEGFARLDAFGQFRRRLEALVSALDAHLLELRELARG